MKERANSWLRFLDRYGGIPLIVLLGLLRKKRSPPSHIKKIALLKTAGIGDTVLLSALIQDLQGREIYLFTGTANAEMASLLPGVQQVIPLPLTDPLSCIKKISKVSVDLWIDCDPWPRINALLSFFSRSLWTLGFQTKGQGRHFIYDQVVPHSFSQHELANYQALLQSVGLATTHLPTLDFPLRSPKKQIVLHLFPGGSQAHLKTWPLSHWKTLIPLLQAKGYCLYFTGSKKDYTQLPQIEGVLNKAGQLSLKETAHLLQESTCVIAVDTGIMHLASTLNCPVIALHGPTSPERWGGIGKQVYPLTPQKKYKPCIQLGFDSRCKKGYCMEAITVDQVLQTFEIITQSTQP